MPVRSRSLPSSEVALSPENYREVHQAAIDAVARGEFTLPMLMDSLPWFRTGGDWTPWRAFLCALYGLPMTPEELECFRYCTGRRSPPTEPASEVWLIAGRRAVKPEPVLPSVQFSSPPALPQQQPVVPLPESAPPPKDEQWTDDTNMETRIQPADPRIADDDGRGRADAPGSWHGGQSVHR